MTARIPRSRLRLQASDLLPGEHAWVRSYDLTVLPDGRVWLSKKAKLVPYAGKGDWPDHNISGDYRVEMTDTGLVLHVYKDEVFGVEHHECDAEDFKDLLAFERVELHVPEHVICEACRGRGWTVRT